MSLVIRSIRFRLLVGITFVISVYLPAFHLFGQEKKPESKKFDEQETLRRFQEEQAIQLLKNSLSLTRSLEDVPKRVLFTARASELLWEYDQEFARTSISDAIDVIVEQYKEMSAQSPHDRIRRLNAAADNLVKILARKDPLAADSVSEQLARIKNELFNDTQLDPSAKEKLSVAREALDVDLEQSVRLARNIIERLIPSTFPQYLYELRRRSPAAADALYRQALSILASRRVYNAHDIIYLSIYAFAERMVLIPIADVDGQDRLTFGIFTHQLSVPEITPATVLANEFLSSAYRHINTELELNSFKVNDAVQLVQWSFLTRKLHFYSSRLIRSNSDIWQQLQTNLEVRCRNAGVDPDILPNIMGFAERLANADDDIFQFGRDSTFDEAKESRDQQQKTQHLVRAIWNVIQREQFQEAESRLKYVEDREVKEKLVDLLHFYAGKAAIRLQNWAEVNNRAGRVADQRIQVVLLLEGSREARRDQKDAAYQFLLEVEKIIPKIRSELERAKCFVAMSGFSADIYPQLSKEALIEAVKAINRSESYDGSDFQVEVAVLKDFRILLPLVNSSLESCFRRAAELDWTGTISLANRLESKTLRISAQIAACQPFVNKGKNAKLDSRSRDNLTDEVFKLVSRGL